MRFDLSADQELVRETARRYLQSEVPLAMVRDSYALPNGFQRDWWRRTADLGWLSVAVPEDLGGYSMSGGVGQDLAVVAEEIGRSVAPGPFQPVVVALFGIARAERAEARAELIAQTLAGERIISWAFGERGNCWAGEDFETRVIQSGGGLVLDGAKAYVEAAAEAEHLLVTARCVGGLAQVLVPINTPGVKVIAGRSIDFVRRFAEVRFENVRLPLSALVGTMETGTNGAEKQLQLALLLQCAETNGLVERAFEFTMDYMRERYAFGRSLASYQSLKHRLAYLLLKIQSGMAATDAALEAFDSGRHDAGLLARTAKVYVASRSTEIIGELVQMTGGIAVTWEYDLHLYQRRIGLNRALYGTPEQYRMEIHRFLMSDRHSV